MFYRITNLIHAHTFFQNDQRQRRRDEVAAGTTWPLKHFVHIDSDPICRSSFTPLITLLTTLSTTDEKLAKLTDIIPAEEDTYVFQYNAAPTPDAKS